MQTFSVLFSTPSFFDLSDFDRQISAKLAGYGGSELTPTGLTVQLKLAETADTALKQAVAAIKTVAPLLRFIRVSHPAAHWERGTLSLK